MAQIMEKICILIFIFMPLTSCWTCNNNPVGLTCDYSNNINDTANAIKDNSIATVKILKTLSDALSIIKENTIDMAQMEKNVYGALKIIKENSIVTTNLEKNINDTLNIIKENIIATAKKEENICPDRYERVINGCFHVKRYQLNYEDARLYCQSINGDLPVVDNMPRFTAYYKRSVGKIWYGARRIDSNHEFLYLNGTVLSGNSSLWEHGYPRHKHGDNDCVALHLSSQGLINTWCTNDNQAYPSCKSDL